MAPRIKKTEEGGFIRELHIVYKRKHTKNAAGNTTISGPERVLELFRDLQDEMKELLIVNLDGTSKILAFEVVAIGSTNACHARPLTKKPLNTAETIGLKLVDHIIIGYEGFYSFASESKLANRFGWY